MSKSVISILAVTLTLGAALCQAQRSSIPFRELERNPVTYLDSHSNDPGAMPGDSIDPRSNPVPSPGLSSGNGNGVSRPAAEPAHERVATRSFFIWNGAQLGMGFLDIAATQHCIAIHTCQEGNPIMPHSWGGQIAVNVSLTGLSAAGSYYMKKRHSKFWYEMPLVGTGAHLVGFISGMRFR